MNRMLVLKVDDGDKARIIKFHSDVVPIKNGGTGAVTVGEARYNLGLASNALATSLTAGLMSPEDKRKLDSLSAGGGSSGELATPETPGLMSPEDKVKLDNLSEAGANLNYETAYNKPSIEGVELEGDIQLEDIGIDIASSDDIDSIFE